MKTKSVLTVLLALLLVSCYSPKYLPSTDDIDANEYGSYIKLTHTSGSKIRGELITIDSDNIVVLSKESQKCVTVPINQLKYLSLRYAKSKPYGWSIPVYTLATLGHGLLAIFTAPLNLIVTISVTASGENAFKYSDKNMTYDKLRMFARFPQGIPEEIDISSIK